jgi:trigger factor
LKVSVEQVSSYEVEMTVEVPFERWNIALDEAYKDYRNLVKIDGFRKGKVPLGIVKKMYGPAIMQDTADKLVRQFYREAVEQENIEAVAPGDIVDLDFGEGKPFKFKAKMEIEPDIEAQGIENMECYLEEVEVDEDDIDTGIQILREEHAIEQSKEDSPIEDGDIITVDIQEVDRTGIPVLTHNWKDIPLKVGKKQFGAEADEYLIGAKAGDKITVPFPEEGDPEKAEKGLAYQFEVKQVKSITLPEVDDEFAKSVSEEFENVGILRERILENMKTSSSQRAKSRMFGRMVEYLIENNRVDVPPTMLDLYLERMFEEAKKDGEELDEEHFKETYRNSAIRNLKWFLLRKRIIQDNGLTATDEIIDEEINRIASETEYSKEMLEKVYSNPKQRDRLKDDIEEKRVLEFLEGKAKISYRKTSYKDFMGKPGEQS